MVQEPLHGVVAAGPDPGGEEPQVLAREVGILLRTGQRELLQGDGLVQHEPGIVAAGGQDVPERAEGIEPREQGSGEPVAPRVQPQGGRTGQDPDSVFRPDRCVVVDPLGIVPHPVAVDQPAAGQGHGGQELPVHRGGHPAEHRQGRPAAGPLPAHGGMVAADAAARHDDGGTRDLKCTLRPARGLDAAGSGTGFEHFTADPGHPPGRGHEFRGAVTEQERDPAGGLALKEFGEERCHQRRTGAPDNVEAGNRVAVPVRAVAAALGPLHEGEQSDSEGREPGAFLPGREVHVRLRPVPGVGVLGPVEGGGREPVGEGKLLAVTDAEPALFGRIDQEEAAEGPMGLAAHGGGRFLVQDHNAPPGGVGLRGGDEPGEPGADDNHVRLDGRPGRARGPAERNPVVADHGFMLAPDGARVWSGPPEPEN